MPGAPGLQPPPTPGPPKGPGNRRIHTKPNKCSKGQKLRTPEANAPAKALGTNLRSCLVMKKVLDVMKKVLNVMRGEKTSKRNVSIIFTRQSQKDRGACVAL